MKASENKGALAGAPENHEGIGSVFLIGVSSIVSSRALPAILLAFVLSACGQSDGAWRGAAPKAPADPAAEAGYLKPPTLTASRRDADGVFLVGQAAPGVVVRLGSPTGEALTATADVAGQWTARLGPSGDVRLLGLSMAADSRQVQAQGYIAILPDGRAAQLRSGASALVIGAGSDAPRLLSIDFDRDGAASVAGSGRPATGISLRIDRTARGAGKIDSQGRFHLVIDRPVASGTRRFEIAGESGEQTLLVPISPAPPLETPFRATRVGPGWRIDWMTPGGGVQSTLILDPAQ